MMKNIYIVFISLNLIFTNSDFLDQKRILIEEIKDSKRMINFKNKNQKNINLDYMKVLSAEKNKNTSTPGIINQLDENQEILPKIAMNIPENQIDVEENERSLCTESLQVFNLIDFDYDGDFELCDDGYGYLGFEWQGGCELQSITSNINIMGFQDLSNYGYNFRFLYRTLPGLTEDINFVFDDGSQITLNGLTTICGSACEDYGFSVTCSDYSCADFEYECSYDDCSVTDQVIVSDYYDYDWAPDIDSCVPSYNDPNLNVGILNIDSENVGCSFDIYVNGNLQPPNLYQGITFEFWYSIQAGSLFINEFLVGNSYDIEIVYSNGTSDYSNYTPTCSTSCEDLGLNECKNSLYGGGSGFRFYGNRILQMPIYYVDPLLGNQAFDTLNSDEAIEFCEELCRKVDECKGFELLDFLVCDTNGNGVFDYCTHTDDDDCVADLIQPITDSLCQDGSSILTKINACNLYDKSSIFLFDSESINTNNAYTFLDYCSDDCPINDCSEDSQYYDMTEDLIEGNYGLSEIIGFADGVLDDCGVCNGSNLSCSDCSGIPNGNSYCFDVISSFDVPNDQGGYVYINWAPHTLDKKLWTKLEDHSISSHGQRTFINSISYSSSLEDLVQECKNSCANDSDCHAFVLHYDLGSEYNPYCSFYEQYSVPSPNTAEFIGNSDTYIYSPIYNTEYITDYLVYKYNPNSRGWELIHQAPARQFEDYSFTAPTNQISIPNQDLIYETEYFVSALSSTGQYYDTEHIFVHSFDNLSPSVPTNLNAEFENNSIVLSWIPNEEADFREYNIYRNGSFLNSSLENFFVDNTFTIGEQNQYNVSAVDLYFNESNISSTVVINTTEDLLLGDITQDGTVNVLDVVAMVGFVVGSFEFTDFQVQLADINEDNVVNVLDVVATVNSIINN